ncbi:hypothetical protein C3F09_04005 [candidate division GN15 bacterium]|uniref:Transcobalamin-like C-terminal domain-containing protein n=1 Tax=candidate division GN15 bacterium TaxID=2072418 RepID=A0A855X8C6_9BACT|nr:MAG: hypothetical protein C3F09_04005 [candidate division GN15 bacterium]
MNSHISNRAVFWAVTLLCVVLSLSCGSQQSGKNDQGTEKNLASQSPGRDSLTIELTGADSVSVFVLLQRSHQVDSWSTAMGVFVNGIDSVKNGRRAVWIYSVNDSLPDIASDRRLTRAGDKVVWHYRLLQ